MIRFKKMIHISEESYKEVFDLAKQVVNELKMKNLTLSVAESATGGYFSNMITNIPGSSKIFIGAVVVYSSYTKNEALNVDYDLINKFGAISPECTEALLDGLKNKISADISIAITGIAGTVKVEGKPHGLMYIGFGTLQSNKIKKFLFLGNRVEIKNQTAIEAFKFILKELETIVDD